MLNPNEKHELLTVLGIIIFFLSVCAVTTCCGISGRTYAGKYSQEIVAESRMAIDVWQKNKVQGRTLLLFDDKLNADSSRDSAVSNENYIDAAIVRNIVRRIIHVVPAERWAEASRNLLATGVVFYADGVFSTTVDGAPLEVLTLERLPYINEKVLVHINGDYFSAAQSAAIAKLLTGGRVQCDIMTITGRSPFKTGEGL